MTNQPFDYIQPRPANHWLNRTYPEKPLTLRRAALYFFLIAAIAFGLAYFYVQAWIDEDVARVEHLRIHRRTVVERSLNHAGESR